MLRLLRFLIWGDGHMHVWEDAGPRVDWFDDPKADTLPSSFTVPMKCKVCGKRKSFRL